jgi:DHA1 family tetracycline resistance protein-like MFS transporter
MTPAKATISLWLVLFAIFLDWVGIGLVYPMFSTMLFHTDYPLLDPGTSDSVRGWYLGMLLAVMSIAQFFSGPILGTLSDQKGRKPLFLLSLSVGVVGYAFCVVGVFAKSIVILIAARAFVGAAAGNAAVVSAAVVDLSTPENKAKHFGLYSMMCGVGFTVGPFLGGKLSEFGFAMPFVVAGLATLLNLALIAYFFQETHVVKKETKIRFTEGLRNLKKAFHIPGLRALFLTVLMFCFGWSFFYEFIPVSWISDYGFNAGRIGVFYAYGAGVYALSSGVLIRPIVDRYKPSTILMWALTALGCVILALLTRPNADWLWVYLPIVNFLAALLFPTYNTIVSNWASKDAQGEVLGILQSIQAAAFAISPLAAGSLLGNNPHMPMLVGGVSMLLGAMILGTSLRGKRL